MNDKFLLNQLKYIPEIIDTTIEMIEVNQPIKIFDGDFIVKTGVKEFTVSGFIQYDWFPITGVNFEGWVNTISKEVLSNINEINYFDIIVNGFNIGSSILTSMIINDRIKIKGTFRFETIIGDKSIAVEKIKFCIPNFRNFLGESTKKITNTNIKTVRNRIILENSKYIITIDKCIDYESRYRFLNEKGGYIITHIAEIKPKKGNLTFQNKEEITHCLNTFLSYINGKRTSALFIQGICNNEVIWSDYSNYHVDMYDFLPSWTYKNDINHIIKIWSLFFNAWSNKDFKDVLKTAIHWYLECNKNSGFVEGAIIMAQTALELLYNWFIVENKKLLIGKDSESISAANKIRLLISQLNINYEIPIKFTSLYKYLKSEKLIDAPEAIVQIRNAIVHSQEEKRKKLRDIDDIAKSEALQLCIWYIELALLKILNYDGIYSNRCSVNLNTSGKIEFVPWKSK